ncbi:MAG: tRNA lysidine(34) synthetase TilS [Lachnospiraceae bacterium]|nr:tRNA lysidine(34) synthetase TilS [Lachnospiraceae bacterium]
MDNNKDKIIKNSKGDIKNNGGNIKDNGSLSALERRVLEFMRKERLTVSGDRVLAAVSGGADSVCLLLVLKNLERLLGIHVEAVTVNHGIRGASADGDVEFVRRLCEEHGIPLRICQVNVPELVKREQISEEEAARRLRYECFEHAAAETGAGVVAVAHHRDDNCETVLHHLFRGSSLKGLGGMAPGRKQGDISVIRPFLQTGRHEIESWLKERGILWRTDETNLEDDYTRNRLRHHVIPLVEREINEQACAHVVQAAEYIAQAQELIEELAGQWLEQYGADRSIPVEPLRSCRPVVRREILIQVCRKAAGGSNLKDVGHVHLEMLEHLAQGENSRQIRLPGGICVRKEYGMLVFFHSGQEVCRGKNKDKKNADEKNISEKAGNMNEEAFHGEADGKQVVLQDGTVIRIEIPVCDAQIHFRTFSYHGEKIPENSYTKWFDYDTIKNGLSLRTRRTGDYFLLDGGGRKTVKSYMIDRKIPADLRDSVVLLAEGSHVLWLSDGRISAAYKVSGDTHNVLELVYLKEERLS